MQDQRNYSLYKYMLLLEASGRVMAVTAGRSLRAYVSHSWPVVFVGAFRVCRADAETDHKCHRGQGRSPRQVAEGGG